MTDSSDHGDARRPPTYQVRIDGHLGSEWTDWFDGFTITLEADGQSLLTGTIIDQAALHGLLRRLRDTGVSLISVNRLADRRDGAALEEQPG